MVILVPLVLQTISALDLPVQFVLLVLVTSTAWSDNRSAQLVLMVGIRQFTGKNA